MARENFRKIIFCLSLILLFVLTGFGTVYAVNNYVASSTNYRIIADTISSGGLLSTSTSYGLQSSLSGISSETSTSTSFSIKSGYLQMITAYLAVSTASNVAMSPAIYTSGGGTGNGSASWTVTTDSSGGYSLSVKASTNPALKSVDDGFDNYSVQVVGVPDFDFRVSAGGNFFGFSPEGSDIRSLYKDDGSSLCNTGGNDTTDKCWDSVTTSNKIVATSVSANHPDGAVTNIKFRAAVGNLVHKKAGSYSATITLTALAL